MISWRRWEYCQVEYKIDLDRDLEYVLVTSFTPNGHDHDLYYIEEDSGEAGITATIGKALALLGLLEWELVSTPVAVAGHDGSISSAICKYILKRRYGLWPSE